MWSTSKIFNKREKGNTYEKIALQFLKKHGLKFIDNNVNFKGGEIDLIMKDDTQLVFIEVRYRSNKQFGGAAASINHSKQQKLMLAAQLYLQKEYGNQPPSCRFDVIAIEGNEHQENIEWLKNVFA